MHLVGVDNVQNCPLKGTAPVRRYKGTIFAHFFLTEIELVFISLVLKL